jgi:hypothetical protein
MKSSYTPYVRKTTRCKVFAQHWMIKQIPLLLQKMSLEIKTKIVKICANWHIFYLFGESLLLRPPLGLVRSGLNFWVGNCSELLQWSLTLSLIYTHVYACASSVDPDQLAHLCCLIWICTSGSLVTNNLMNQKANSLDPDQMGCAGWSGSKLFALAMKVYLCRKGLKWWSHYQGGLNMRFYCTWNDWKIWPSGNKSSLFWPDFLAHSKNMFSALKLDLDGSCWQQK